MEEECIPMPMADLCDHFHDLHDCFLDLDRAESIESGGVWLCPFWLPAYTADAVLRSGCGWKKYKRFYREAWFRVEHPGSIRIEQDQDIGRYTLNHAKYQKNSLIVTTNEKTKIVIELTETSRASWKTAATPTHYGIIRDHGIMEISDPHLFPMACLLEYESATNHETQHMKENRPVKKFRRMVGIILAIATVALLLWFCSFFETQKWAARRASGGNDLAEIWFACEAYAKDHHGVLPPLDKEPGRLMFDRSIMYSDYRITGKSVTMEYDDNAPVSWDEYDRNPALLKEAKYINDHSYWYLGYAVVNDAEGLLFLQAYRQQVLKSGSFEQDLSVLGKGKNVTIPRLCFPDGPAAHSAITRGANAAASRTPVCVERPGHYRRYSGGFVLYLDGHREFIEYPGRFPMSSEFIDVLKQIDLTATAAIEADE